MGNAYHWSTSTMQGCVLILIVIVLNFNDAMYQEIEIILI